MPNAVTAVLETATRCPPVQSLVAVKCILGPTCPIFGRQLKPQTLTHPESMYSPQVTLLATSDRGILVFDFHLNWDILALSLSPKQLLYEVTAELQGLPPDRRVSWPCLEPGRWDSSTCRTQNGTSESIPQTIPHSHLSSDLRHSLYCWSWAYSNGRSYSTLRQDRYEYSMTRTTHAALCPPLPETAENARGPYHKAGFAKTKRPTGPHSWDMEGTAPLYTVLCVSSSSLERGRLHEHWGGGSFYLTSQRPGLDAALFNLGPWLNTPGWLGQR